jgi:hypothetical protein
MNREYREGLGGLLGMFETGSGRPDGHGRGRSATINRRRGVVAQDN